MHLPLSESSVRFGETRSIAYDDVVKPPYIFPRSCAGRSNGEAAIQDNGRLKVGLAWAGSKTNKNDRHRSITLSMLAAAGRVRERGYL